ncbi:DUF7882 family protein [Microbacterium sp. 22242]|uniref:DUF7882 family protein n=1 Tax=Microbacterium sp. 22242 TaxID=3453896 RepID=UPI003F85824E
MGTLTYGVAEHCVEIEDVTLEHLEVIITAKLLRGESVLLSVDAARPDGADRIWLRPTIPIRFDFRSPAPPPLDPERISDLAAAVDRPGGLVVPDPNGLR